MIATDAPVETGLAHRPPRAADGVEVNAELDTEVLSARRQHQLGVGKIKHLPLRQMIEHAHAEIAGEVVVANPRLAHLRIFWAGADTVVAGVIGKTGERLECRRDLRIFQAEVAMTALLLR